MRRRCYLVAHLNAAEMPPVLTGFGLYSDPAHGLTTFSTKDFRAFNLDWFSVEADSFQEANDRMVETLQRDSFYLGREWLRPYMRAVLEHHFPKADGAP